MNYIKVDSFQALSTTAYKASANAICWDRHLAGDFKEIVDKLTLKEDITIISVDDLKQLSLTDAAALARNTIINDLTLLGENGAQPSLNLIKAYERDDYLDFISTDVYSYHVDRSPIPTHTYLCTYYGACSDFIPNEQAIQKIQVPAIREKLLELYEGPEDAFDQFLIDEFYDLHYAALPNAQAIHLGLGQLWRLAVDHPQQTVLPCIHRAPAEGSDLRLMLIC